MNFNDIDFSQYFTIEKVSGDIMPPVIKTTISIPGRDGGIHQNTRLDERIIQIAIRLIENSKQDLAGAAEMLAPLLLSREEKPLITHRRPNRMFFASLQGSTDLEELYHTGGTQLVFTCTDPYCYSTVETVATNIGANNGEFDAKPLISFNVAANTNQITLSDGTYTITLVGAFLAGEAIEIDTNYPPKVKYKGVVDMQIVAPQSFLEEFRLPVGSWSIVTSPAQTITTKYRERFL